MEITMHKYGCSLTQAKYNRRLYRKQNFRPTYVCVNSQQILLLLSYFYRIKKNEGIYFFFFG